MRVLLTRSFARFCRQERIDAGSLNRAVGEIDAGLIHADLGGGLIKQRIARSGGGKSGGYRSLLVWRRGDLVIFLAAFAKNGQANLTVEELELARMNAKALLRARSEDLDRLVADGKLQEIDYGK